MLIVADAGGCLQVVHPQRWQTADKERTVPFVFSCLTGHVHMFAFVQYLLFLGSKFGHGFGPRGVMERS